MTDLDAALAWCDVTVTVDLTKATQVAFTLAAAVLALMAERDTFYMKYRCDVDQQLKDKEVDLQRVEAALVEMRGRTCDSCTFRWHHVGSVAGDRDVCGKVSIPGHSVAVVMCEQLGRACGAWASKEQA